MKKIHYIAAVLTTVLAMTSCNDWLDQKPISNVTTGSYFQQASDFEDAANRLYDQCYGWATTFSSNEMFAINFDNGSDLSSSQNEEISGTKGVQTSDTYYTKAYQCLRHVNNLLDQAETYTGPGNINNAVGTAYFFRAWWHFFLLKRFGGITLMTTAPDTKSDIVWGPRNSRYEVIASILSDLAQAQQLVTATKASTSNNGSLTIEAVCAFKARVALFEGTWEKYNGVGSADATNGDGTNSGAGTAVPSGYPSVEELLNIAKTESAKFVNGVYANEYSIWMGVEDNAIEDYQKTSSFYLFCLEGSGSNPSGLDKSSNDEAIFRKCYDYAQQRYSNMNLTHSGGGTSGNRKLMDMYLCSDGLPIHISPLFKGYHEFASEFENRDARMTSLFSVPGRCYWKSNSEGGVPANYSISPADDSGTSISMPNMRTYSVVGYGGRKFTSEERRAEYQQSQDYLHIRLPEMLLVYAEATIELSGNISDAELDRTVNLIRKRAHIANLTNALVNSNGLNMKEEIRRERALELFGEGHRVSDLCRWGIAEKELARPTCSYYVSYNGTPTMFATESDPNNPAQKIYDASVWADKGYVTTADADQSTYTAGMPKVKAGALIIETQPNRIFSKKNYLQSIPTNEIELNPELKQNPQW